MNAEQKQRALAALGMWHSSNDDSLREYQAAELMAGLLQELVDAPEPDGWRVVPLTATGDMRNAGRSHLTGMTSYADSTALKVYGAMLAAAPPAPSVPDIWEVAKEPYPKRVIDNPDPVEWANYFVHTFPQLIYKRDLMADWFKAAMMAMWFSIRENSIPEYLKPAEAPADVARDAELLDWLTAKCVTLECNKYARIITITVDSEIALDQRHQVDLRGAIKTAIEREKLKAAMSEKGQS